MGDPRWDLEATIALLLWLLGWIVAGAIIAGIMIWLW
jgi:hypothetical protein